MAPRPKTKNEGDNRIYKWRAMIPRYPELPTSRFGPKLPEFFKLGLTLVRGDLGVLQETIKLLASEGGLISIRELIEEHVQRDGSPVGRIGCWRACVKPLFKMLMEGRVSNSTLLENSTGAIYNTLFGYNGSRMQPLYDFLLCVAADWGEPITKNGDGEKSEFLELCTSVLTRLVDCNTQALVNCAIPPIVEQLQASLDSLESEKSNFWIRQSNKNLEYVRKRLSVVKGDARNRPAATHSLTRASFVLRRDLPGELSEGGPRHDNDHADCTKIRILPTMSEIMAARQDYRPFYDPAQLHLPGIQGLVDRHFRLLRDDMVGQLKESISYELQILNNPEDKLASNRSIRTYTYCINDFIDITCTRHNGLEFQLEIEQPFRPDENSKMTLEEWWKMSRRLEPGALVCVLQKATAIFCVVSASTKRPDPERRKTRGGGNQGIRSQDLYSHSDFSYVSLRLAEAQPADVEIMVRAFNSGLTKQRVLVEFPGVLLPSFQSTLLALQHIHKTVDLPFSELLAPDAATRENTAIQPPLYSTKRGFAFNLKSITNKGEDLLYSPQDPPDPQLLVNKSQLDYGQAVACLNALRRSFQVIQGPPGTGKSWTGEGILKVLLDNRGHAGIGPILCVCYTNHALDQLLEHLWHRGITQIIRIGSRSKSTILEKVNLRKVAREIERTKAEKKEAWVNGTKLTEIETWFKDCVGGMKFAASAKGIKEHLLESGSRAFREAIFGLEEEEGWQKVTYKDEEQALKEWILAGFVTEQPPRSIDVTTYQEPDSLSQLERRLICQSWTEKKMEDHIRQAVYLAADYQDAKRDFDSVHREIDLRVLSQCHIIGVTTTGLARNLELLRKVNSKVLLCEEAGEVLESHILTALLPSLEHVILIGDHLQLRPQITNYELSVNNPLGEQYSLDVSLFERLVKPVHPSQSKLPFDTLTIQRRMHPSISSLIRETIYPSLEDAAHLSDYPAVVGMRKRLFWFDHNKPENKANPAQPLSTSRTNNFEVEMVAGMVSHLVRQGVYAHNQIAVITPYLGQLHMLRSKLRNSFEIVLGDQDMDDLEKEGLQLEAGNSQEIQKKSLGRCITLATVDNFQGEEADVVVISLVRSNEDGRCGFLKTSNRINVLLSRAKHGMYIFGNSATYAHVPMWSNIIGMLKAGDNFGNKLPLQCPRHSEKTIDVGSLEDFTRLSPEAGCNSQCLQRLSCGHTCKSSCHSSVLHKAVRCLEACPRSKKFCDHPCPNVCGDQCEERCSVVLEGHSLELPCGHMLTSPQCWQLRELSSIKCMAVVDKYVPGCGHKVRALCKEDVSKNAYICKARCDHPLACGHLCSQQCRKCRRRDNGKLQEVFHPPCKAPCGRNYSTCSHTCSQACHPHVACPPCDKPCEIKCNHSQCSKKCSEPCTPCAAEECFSKCPHSQCTMPCAAPCNWTPCSKRCARQLACGHQCPSLCGEVCPEPNYCQICAPAEIRAMNVDMLEMREYHEIDLDAEPCIFPDCMHVLTITSMDGQLAMSDHYEMADDGKVTGIKETTGPTQVKSCPTCRGSLRNISRYGRLVRRALLDESTSKFIAWSQTESMKFEKRLLDQQERLDRLKADRGILETIGRQGELCIAGPRNRQLSDIAKWVGHGRYAPVLKLYLEISKYARQVAIEEQPYQRVDDLVKYARRRGTGAGQFMLNPSNLETGGTLVAWSLMLRCDLLLIRDFINIRRQAIEELTTVIVDLEVTLNDCNELMKLASRKKYVRHELEGHIYFVQFAALARLLYSKTQSLSEEETKRSEDLRAQGQEHLSEARVLLSRHEKQTLHLVKEFEAAELMLNDFVRYTPISVQEKRDIWLAMSREFRGTGHWYRCENGHPFTIGECGMPMEQAICPECGAAVGGSNHTAVEGVRRDEEMDALGVAAQALSI